jgi:hypothetical protein
MSLLILRSLAEKPAYRKQTSRNQTLWISAQAAKG